MQQLDPETVKATADVFKAAGPVLTGLCIVVALFLLAAIAAMYFLWKSKGAAEVRDGDLVKALQAVKESIEKLADDHKESRKEYIRGMERVEDRSQKLFDRQYQKDEQYLTILKDLKSGFEGLKSWGDRMDGRMTSVEQTLAKFLLGQKPEQGNA